MDLEKQNGMNMEQNFVIWDYLLEKYKELRKTKVIL